jgi:hypothetical protein
LTIYRWWQGSNYQSRKNRRVRGGVEKKQGEVYDHNQSGLRREEQDPRDIREQHE